MVWVFWWIHVYFAPHHIYTIIFRGVPNTTAVPYYSTMMMMMGFSFFFPLHFPHARSRQSMRHKECTYNHICSIITIRQMIMFESRLRVYKCVVALKLFIYFWIWNTHTHTTHVTYIIYPTGYVRALFFIQSHCLWLCLIFVAGLL